MRLHHVVLENFGVYSRQKLEFDGAPLVLVYGPNESGKTTALNGLRSAMFGFPVRTPYLTGKTMSAEVVGRLADGTQFQFTRKKARKDDVVGKLGARRLVSGDLSLIFGEMDLENYQQLFGFSLDELRAGEAALKNAKLSEALAGGGMGGAAALQQLRHELATSVTTLFRARGASQIGNLLGEIRQRQEELKSLQTLPLVVEELRSQWSSALQSGQEVKSLYAELHQQLARAERLQQAYPKLQELRRIEQVLKNTNVPPGIDAAFIGRWSDYAEQQAKLTLAIQQERQRLEHEQRALAQLAGTGLTTAHETRIETLGHQAREIPQLRQQLEDLQRQLTESTDGWQRALETLGLDVVSDNVLQLTISVPQRTEIEGWLAEHDRLHQQLLGSDAKLEATADQLTQLASTDEQLETPENLPALNELVSKLVDAERHQELLAESIRKKCESPEFEVLGARLRAKLQDCPDLDYRWPVPGTDEVARHLHNSEELQRALVQMDREIQRLETDLAGSERALREIENASEQSTWGELNKISQQRDLVINGWLDELTEPLLASSISPDQQKLRLQQLKLLGERSDGLLQQLIETAEALAKISHLKKHIRASEEELLVARNQLDQERVRHASLEQQWLIAWQNCPFRPLSPELMNGWVRDFATWSATAAELDIERRKVVTSRAGIKQLRGELIDQWPLSVDFETPVSVLHRQLNQWAQRTEHIQSQTARRAAVQNAYTELQSRHAGLLTRQQEITSTYAKWLKEHALPAAWPLTHATTLLENQARLKRDYRSATRYSEQISELQQRLQMFETGVADLAKLLDEARGELPEEIIAERWLTALQSTRQDTAERAKLTASIEHGSATLAERETRLAEIEQGLASLAASLATSASGPGREALAELMQRAKQAAELRIARNELLSTLETLAAKDALEQFLGLLEETDESQIAVQVLELRRRLSQCEAQRQQTDQQVGALSSRLDQLANSETAQRAQHLLHAQRGQLAEFAEQWVVGRLAQELLTRCIDRFTNDHEPALLQLTHQFLSKLTGGRYVSVEHDGSSAGSFRVRNADGEAVEPAKLSTGTREQLYLAIRLAFITHYTEHHEPLPVLMDDCFVNFDDARTRLALRTLLNWNGAVQTILLSCHGRVVSQLAELAPDTPVICLEKSATLPARELVSELALVAN